MPYQRTFSTLGCAGFSLDEVVALAGRHGIAGVELRGLGGSLNLADYFDRNFDSPERASAWAGGAAVRILALDTSFKLSDVEEANREALLRLVPWAEALKVPYLRVFDGGRTGDVDELRQAAATLGWWRELRGRKGWKCDLMVETHDSLFTAAAIGRLLAIAPDTALLWDAHHTWKRSGEDPAETWRKINGHVVHVHVKDSVSRPSARHPFTYVLPGDGEFPAGKLFAALRADDFSGPVSLEWERFWHPYLVPLTEALAVAAARVWW